VSEARQTLRKPIWLTLLLAVLAGATSFAAAQLLDQLGRDPVALMVAGVAFLLVVATVDALIARVTMRGDEISITRGLRHRRFYRGHIAAVRWKAGEGVSLELDDGLMVGLPELGRGPARARTIRAWLDEGLQADSESASGEPDTPEGAELTEKSNPATPPAGEGL